MHHINPSYISVPEYDRPIHYTLLSNGQKIKWLKSQSDFMAGKNSGIKEGSVVFSTQHGCGPYWIENIIKDRHGKYHLRLIDFAVVPGTQKRHDYRFLNDLTLKKDGITLTKPGSKSIINIVGHKVGFSHE